MTVKNPTRVAKEIVLINSFEISADVRKLPDTFCRNAKARKDIKKNIENPTQGAERYFHIFKCCILFF